MLFIYTVCVKGPTPLRHGRTCEILLALENGNFHCYPRATSAKILSIQYFNVPHHLATDSRRVCTRCILFPASDLSTSDDSDQSWFVSDYFRSRTTWRRFTPYAFTLHMRHISSPVFADRLSCLSDPWSVCTLSSSVGCRTSHVRNTCEHACSTLSIFVECARVHERPQRGEGGKRGICFPPGISKKLSNALSKGRAKLC